DRNGLASVPLRVVFPPLPLGRRSEPLDLVGQIDTAHHAHTERGGPLVDLVDANHVGDGVEVHIARLLDGMPQVDRAVASPAETPALEVAAVEIRVARAVHVEIRRDDALLESGE